MTLSILAYKDMEATIAYGTQKGSYALTTKIFKLRKGEPSEVVLSTLDPDTQYHYRLDCREQDLDGEISWHHSTHFAQVKRTLAPAQKQALMRLRNLDGYPCTGAYLYSEPIPMPDIPDTTFLFVKGGGS